LNQNDLSSLNAWFQSVDRDRSGEISVAELTSLNFNNRQLGPDLAKKLIAVFDKDHSGQINFQEYASLHQFLVSMQNAFNTADKTRRGFLDTNEVQTAIQMAGFQLSPTAVQHATRRFDTMKRGMLSWEEYLNLCAHLAYMRSIFEWSDSDRDGKVTFDYEQFIYATLYI
jgi:Ca2+-binding EF-hand superfamily protein